MASAPIAATTVPASEKRWSRAVLGLILFGFLVVRLPFVLWQPCGQDEDLVSVPGLMLAREGVPRIPYIEARESTSFYNGTEQAVMFYPPGGFLAQAAFYLCLPPGHATARLAGLTAAAVSIALVFALGRKVYGTEAGLWGAGLFAASRPLMFVAVTSRPDALCAALGLGALLVIWDYRRSPAPWRLTVSGLLLGLGLFTHPFAIVYCLLCAVWVLATPDVRLRRLLAAGLLTAVTLLTASLWLIFILQYPDEFRDQFLHNVVHRVPGSLVGRLAWPWPYFDAQLRLLREHAGTAQLVLLIGGELGAVWFACRSRNESERALVLISAAGVYLLIGFLGGYQTKMYWSFVLALWFTATGGCLASILRGIARPTTRRSCRVLLLGALALACAPGAGLTMWWKLVRPDPEHRYHAPQFIAQMLSQLPAAGRFAVDTPYILEAWLSGRDVALQEETEIRAGRTYDYDWLLMGRNGLAKQLPQHMGGEFVRAFGDRNDPLACYAELYRVTRPAASH